MTNGEMFKEVFGYDLFCKECQDGWRNYEYKGSVHYHFDPEKGRYINDNPQFIPLSVIEKIRTEIKQAPKRYPYNDNINNCLTEKEVLEIIDQAIKECDKNE